MNWEEFVDVIKDLFKPGSLLLSLVIIAVTFGAMYLLVPVLRWIARILGIYEVVEERQAIVYVVFGRVTGVITEPGLHFLWKELKGWALIVNWLGDKYVVDMRLDQEYLRSLPVNSEEGAPMGVGLWYEMYIDDPLAYIFKNTDPRGSLAAHVGNSTVRCLSNLPLDQMLADRHAMSSTVSAEVSEKTSEWGYRLGSCYIRKVHFRDAEMIKQIQSKVVNRLRQVTSSIKQDGANRVSIIAGAAEKSAAIDFGKAAAIRPNIVGAALEVISKDADVASALFEIMEATRIRENGVPIEFIPQGTEVLAQLSPSPAPLTPPEPQTNKIRRRPKTFE